ncbi:MAG: VPLPA-CTERM-specific exosortase XrtD [Gammaproteobacteria bacterium]|nr:VPLPA-CTERM-specific exosortase XrtD [Gammaproteobacteria bacterium]
MSDMQGGGAILRLPVTGWILALIALTAGYVAFRTGVDYTATQIWERPEYSHGLIIPFIAAFLAWQHRDWLERQPYSGSWWGVVLLIASVLLNVVGQLASMYLLQRYAALLAFYGLVLALLGGRVFRRLWVALLILLFLIPLPDALYGSLSTKLQLISSSIGVGVIRLFGISVFLEGNVIDLGTMQLQVAEACSGLRYLFPLMTLGFIAAYFFKAAFWKRLIVFLSSIPITVAMNSLRIGLIGVTVEYWGRGMAEGVLHDFEGWVVFMASAALMLLEIVLLSRLGRDRRPWRQVFGVELPPPVPKGVRVETRTLPLSFHVSVGVLLAAAALAQILPQRGERIPARQPLIDYPMTLAGYLGTREPIDAIYLETLRLDDYLLADYAGTRADAMPVNLYVAWYDSQRTGHVTHSPAACLPAGGWAIERMVQASLPEVRIAGHAVRVNRAIIRRGESRQLVYYFFKQRRHVLTGEYAINAYLFWDALTRNRTDGALIRFVTPLARGEPEAAADARLTVFARTALAELGPYVPD